MTCLRLAMIAVFGLPLFTLPACNHHTVMQLPRADAGPDAGWGVDFGRATTQQPTAQHRTLLSWISGDATRTPRWMLVGSSISAESTPERRMHQRRTRLGVDLATDPARCHGTDGPSFSRVG